LQLNPTGHEQLASKAVSSFVLDQVSVTVAT
jgi:hypothetical protein